MLVAAQDLQIGASLRQEDLRAVQWPSNAVPAGAFGKPEDLIGRGLIMPVMTNEPFLPSKLASKGRVRDCRRSFPKDFGRCRS